MVIKNHTIKCSLELAKFIPDEQNTQEINYNPIPTYARKSDKLRLLFLNDKRFNTCLM